LESELNKTGEGVEGGGKTRENSNVPPLLGGIFKYYGKKIFNF